MLSAPVRPEAEGLSWSVAQKVGATSARIQETLATTLQQEEAADEQGVTKHERAFREAVEKGKIKAQDVVGRLYGNMCKVNQKMKEEYEAAKTNDAKERLRLKWAEGELEKFKAVRSKREELENTTSVRGRYKPFGKIVVDEGGDPEAYVAAENIAKSCITLHKAGKRIGTKAFLKYNGMSKRVEFMHLEDGFDEVNRTIDTTVFDSTLDEILGEPVAGTPVAITAPLTPGPTPSPKHRAAPQDTPQRPEQPAEVDQRTEGKTPRTEDKTIIQMDNVPPRKRVSRKPESAPEDVQAAKQAKKDLDKEFKAVESLKMNMIKATAGYNDILDSIKNDPAWKWADTTATLQPLEDLKRSIETTRRSTKFTILWSMNDSKSFVSSAKKTFTEAEIKKELANLKALSQAVTDLQSGADSVKGAHAKMKGA